MKNAPLAGAFFMRQCRFDNTGDASLEHSIEFRQATLSDIPAMSAIRLAVTENALSDPGRITEQMYRDYLELLGRGWVAESNGTVIGFSYAEKQNASIWALFVHPDQEGRGAAKALLKLATDWLFRLGHQRVRLSTGANTRADRFYSAQGWTRETLQGSTDVGYTLAARPGACALSPVIRP